MVEDLFDKILLAKCKRLIWFRTYSNESSLVLWLTVLTRLEVPFRCARWQVRPSITRLDWSGNGHQKNGTEGEDRTELNVHHLARGRLLLR
jgi:hypothetical protein